MNNGATLHMTLEKKNKKEQNHDKDAFLHELLAVLHFYLQWIHTVVSHTIIF